MWSWRRSRSSTSRGPPSSPPALPTSSLPSRFYHTLNPKRMANILSAVPRFYSVYMFCIQGSIMCGIHAHHRSCLQIRGHLFCKQVSSSSSRPRNIHDLRVYVFVCVHTLTHTTRACKSFLQCLRARRCFVSGCMHMYARGHRCTFVGIASVRVCLPPPPSPPDLPIQV